jgi:glycosyltransferase involved in cell wall biosynthesis
VFLTIRQGILKFSSWRPAGRLALYRRDGTTSFPAARATLPTGSERAWRPSDSFVDGTGERSSSSTSSDRGRILVIAPQPFFEDRGTPIAVHQVVRALTRLGYGVDVLTYPLGRSPELPGVRLFRIRNPFGFRSVPIGLSVRKLVLDTLLVPAVWKRLRAEEYRCVHAVEEAAFPAIFFAREFGVPVVYDMQSSLPEQLTKYRVLRSRPAQRILSRLEQWLLERADWVVSSSGLADRVRTRAPCTRVSEWTFAAEPSAPTSAEIDELRQRIGIGPGARVVLYTGTFEEYQGLRTLMAAVPLVRERLPDTTFVLVGAQNADPAMIYDAYRGAGDAVRILPRQPRERIPAFLALADVVVSPRAYGGNIPLKIFDYLAAGRPIVATDLPTHRSILTEERAVLVPPTPEAFAGGITWLLEDREHADRIAAAGRAWACEHLSWKRFEDSIGAVYDAVCNTDPDRRERRA